ncbi:MAG: hypothetical protein K2P99_01880 [Burkholderiales bacterium]|nr:hypothetical protein [Burkholderiales bacterium]
MKDIFINRKEELKLLTNGLRQINDYVLIAPRRFGKTSLAFKILEQFYNDKKYIIIHLDLMYHSGGTIRGVAEAIIEKSFNALGLKGRLRNIWHDLSFNLELKVKYNDLEIEPMLKLTTSEDEWQLLEYALNLPEKIAIKEKKTAIVFYDEFGELELLGERAIKAFRSVIQLHKHVSYLFAGSQETIMKSIFTNIKGAFYKFGTIILLTELNKKDLYEFLVELLPELLNNEINLIDVLINDLQGHPYYTSEVIKYFLLNKDKCNVKYYSEYVYNTLYNQSKLMLDPQIQLLKKKQHALDILRLIIEKANPYEYQIKEQNIYHILQFLTRDGYIKRVEKGKYTVIDPMLARIIKYN